MRKTPGLNKTKSAFKMIKKLETDLDRLITDRDTTHSSDILLELKSLWSDTLQSFDQTWWRELTYITGTKSETWLWIAVLACTRTHLISCQESTQMSEHAVTEWWNEHQTIVNVEKIVRGIEGWWGFLQRKNVTALSMETRVVTIRLNLWSFQTKKECFFAFPLLERALFSFNVSSREMRFKW